MKRIPIGNRAAGAIIMALGAVLFSTKAVFVKIAYQYNVDSVTLLMLRMLFALPFYIIILGYVSWRNQNRLNAKVWFKIITLGIVGYYLASLFDFMGLQYITAGLERIILFCYPTFVVIISAVMLRKKIIPAQLLALGITYSGIAVVYAGNVATDNNEKLLLGGGLVLISAVTYAMYIVGSGELIPRVGTLRFTSVAMIASAGAVITHQGVVSEAKITELPSELLMIALAIAVIATVIPSFLISEGIKRLGASDAAIVASVGPVSTIILAYFFLGEQLTWIQIGGVVLVIAGVVRITSYRKP